MQIGELARATGLAVDTIRYYERAGLMPAAARSGSNYRLYEAAHADRLSFIRHCRSLGMTLDEIRRLLHFKDQPADNCGEVNALLDEHIGQVARRVRELRQLQRQLQALRDRCGEAREAAHCGILHGLAESARQPGTPAPIRRAGGGRRRAGAATAG